MWEPNMTGATSSPPPRTPMMLPMASTVTARPRSRIHRTSRSRPARSSSLSASRQWPPPGNAPRDTGGRLRRGGQRGDESFGCFAIAASGHDAGGIGGGICYGCRQRPHDFDAFRRHDLAHEGRANLRIAARYLFHHLVAVAAKECFVADRSGDAEPFEQAGEKNPRRAARLRVRVTDRTSL